MQTLDLFLPEEQPRGTLMYIHGGYWRSLDKSDASHVAPAFTAKGYAVAVVNYALCPSVTVDTIVGQIREAAAWLHLHHAEWQAPPSSLFVCGHSAGGHLAALLLATDWAASQGAAPGAAVCISGIYDLRPLLQVASVMDAAQFTSRSARVLSPALLTPAGSTQLLTAIGLDENPGFHEQAKAISESWQLVHVGHVICPDRDHFTILDELTDPSGTICRAVLKLMHSFNKSSSP